MTLYISTFHIRTGILRRREEREKEEREIGGQHEVLLGFLADSFGDVFQSMRIGDTPAEGRSP